MCYIDKTTSLVFSPGYNVDSALKKFLNLFLL